MRGKILKAVVLFQATLVLLIANLAILSNTRKPSYAASIPGADTASVRGAVANAPTGMPQVLGASVTAGDARSLLLADFIRAQRPNSPFLAYTDTIVSLADQYKIDYRLVPAIAMCESNLGTRIPSSDSYNAWGIAVYTGQQNGKKFRDWNHALDWVSRFIREKFYDRGITNLRDIGAVWAPPSVEKDYSWTRCVEGFMDKIR